MPLNGLFTYKNLYAGKPENYHYNPLLWLSSSLAPNQLSPTSTLPPSTTVIIPTSQPEKLVPSTEIESNTELNKLADIIPFAYFYWLLVLLAILLTFTLITVFICYCRTFIKNYKAHRESLSSFNRYRSGNRRVHSHNIYKPTVAPSPPLSLPLPLPSLRTPPCPSKSLESVNNQLHGQDFDLAISPPTSRLDLYPREPLSTFASSTSNLHSGIQSRSSTRSSDPPSKVDLSYESQTASVALNDELKNRLSTIDIN